MSSTRTTEISNMEVLTNQLGALKLSRDGGSAENQSKKNLPSGLDTIQPLAKRWMSSDIPPRSDMTANGEELVFTCPEGNSVVVPHKTETRKYRTSGAMCIPGAPLMTATSGYGRTSFPAEHQLRNDSGEPVQRMCAELGYHLASHIWEDKLDNGQYLAVHVEKRLLCVHYNEYIRRKNSMKCNTRQWSVFGGGHVTIYIDRRPCFDCILFANYCMITTDTLIEIYYRKREHVSFYCDGVLPMAIRLKVWSGLLNDEDIDEFIHFQEGYTFRSAAPDEEVKKLFAASAETYTEWIDKFNKLYEHRLEEYK